MKIFPISDIHSGIWHPMQKYWSSHFSFLNDVDVMCIAGDAGEPIQNIVMIAQLLLEFPNLEIVYVPGNHDFYGMNIDQALESYVWAEYSLDRLHLLTGYQYSTWVYGDFAFIGATLWTDFNDKKPLIMNEVKKGLHDYDTIRSGRDGKLITPDRILNEHYKQRKTLFKSLERNKDKRCIVVTHHKPYLSPAITEGLTYGYEVDLMKALDECKCPPEVWISGHTHKSEWKEHDFTHGHTLFMSNQFGYPEEDTSVTGFHKDCILEL